MKILHVVSSHIDSGPGAAALRMMLACRAAGLETTLACIPGKSLVENARKHNFQVIEDLTFVRDAKLWQLPGARRKFTACVHDNGFQLVHLHQSPEMFLATLALANDNIPLIRHWHDATVGLGAEPLRLFLQKPRRLVLGSSNAATAALRKKFPKVAAQIDWQPATIDCSLFSPDLRTADATRAQYGAIRVQNDLDTAPAGGVLIGIPGRIAERRAIYAALEALFKLSTRIPWSAMFFGQGEDAQNLRQKIADAGKGSQIHVFDNITDWPLRMASCDIALILKPGSDGAVRSVIEAFACGVPCVIGNEGGLQDLAAGIPGRWPEEAQATAAPGAPSASGLRASVGTQMLQRQPGASGTRMIPKPGGSGLQTAPGGPAQSGTRTIPNPALVGGASGSPSAGGAGSGGTAMLGASGAPERQTRSLGALAVDPAKPADIAMALAAMIDDLHRRAQMREAARATALRRYEQSHTGKRLIEHYRKLVGF
ncbi:MAG TPA: glycosyltransferase [Planctomycetota bacterium]|nr:glycosyltransferase [Planctomycetota bacterium]